jgi:hypothetical protein
MCPVTKNRWADTITLPFPLGSHHRRWPSLSKASQIAKKPAVRERQRCAQGQRPLLRFEPMRSLVPKVVTLSDYPVPLFNPVPLSENIITKKEKHSEILLLFLFNNSVVYLQQNSKSIYI